MKAKKWLLGWTALVLAALVLAGSLVWYVDPYFHYHAPHDDRYYYPLEYPRYINDGILRHFSYDAVITGTSLCQNFRTSELDALFGVSSVKTCFPGGPYYEINRALETALQTHPETRLIVRGLDMAMIFDGADRLRNDLGVYPEYLYDETPFNDAPYLFSKSLVLTSLSMLYGASHGRTPGIASFDDYSRWQDDYTYGRNAVLTAPIVSSPGAPVHMTEDDRARVYENVTQNITALAERYPDVEFYLFLTPYSAAWWSGLVNDGTVYRQLEGEQYLIELLLPHRNIHLFSFNTLPEITTDLNNYKDTLHYADWVNRLILRSMHDGEHRLTPENYRDYLAQERALYTTFDYESLNTQTDCENDADAPLCRAMQAVN